MDTAQLDAAATPLEAEAGDKTPLNRVMRARIMARRYTTTKLSRLEWEILSRWFDGEDLDSDLIERFVKRYETEWCANWSVPGDYLDDEVVVGTLVGNRFEAVKVLSVWGSWMMAGGVDIYLVDVDSHDRQLLYFDDFDDSILECSCASRLCTFTTDAIMQELRSIVGRVYSGEGTSPWDGCESILVSKEEIINWRAEMFADYEEG